MDCIIEDVKRTELIRNILDLCKELDKKIDYLIDNHYMTFYQRKSTKEEWICILEQVNKIMRKEMKESVTH